MALRGRPPIPTALKILNGNPGKRPLNDAEPKPPLGVPDCPDWLHAYAREKWAEVVPLLSACRVLTMADGDVLAAYCVAWAELRLASEILDAEGRTCIGGSGGTKQHPAITMQRTALQVLERLFGQLGLSPAARVRLRVDPTPNDDPLEEFIRGDKSKAT